MAKNIFQDMVKVNHTRRGHTVAKPEKAPKIIEKIDREEINPVSYRNDRPKNHRGIWVVATVAIVFFLFALSYFFARGEITLSPKIKEVNLNQNFSAVSGGVDDVLPFNMVAISGEEKQEVSAGEERQVSIPATGQVVIYNNFSQVPQKLDINTRLEGSNGKLYKTAKAVTVPGLAGTTPGKVEVGVYGAEPGDSYNSKPLDFKIFGFKGTPKYEKFYARSTGDLSGGFIGKSKVPTAEDRSKAEAELKDKLRADLWQKANNQIPEGFILFKDAVILDIDNGGAPTAETTASGSTISIKGTLYGALFSVDKLSKKIVEDSIDLKEGEDVYISNLNDLTFKFSDLNTTLKDVKTLNFSLSGVAKFVWRVDEKSLMQDLLGRKKKEFNQVLLKYPNIDSASLSLSPVWNRTLPSKEKDIKILVNYP